MILTMRPEPGSGMPDPGRAVTPAPDGWLDQLADLADLIPGWVWAIALAVLTLFTITTLPFARSQAFKAGRRAAGNESSNKGTALFVAAMIPAAFFWLAVLAGSFRGLAAFGRDTLGWSDGWEYLVPLTLDGVAISFGFLAFRAVRSGRSPDRANRVVMGAAVGSALINYVHEVSAGGSALGGGYLALLSVFGMLIFHEFLDQFTEGTAYIQRVNPKFGLRWLTWPSNTVCAWIAWRNYPPMPLPAGATETQRMWWGSVNHAIAHLNTVRRTKRVARFNLDLVEAKAAPVWWTRIAPWVRVRQLDTALVAEQAETTEMRTRLAAVEAAHRQTVAESERRAAELARTAAEKQAAENRAADAEQRATNLRAAAERDKATLTAAADRRIAAAEAERAHLSARLDQAETEVRDTRRENGALTYRLTAAEAEVATSRRALEAEVASIRVTTETEADTGRDIAADDWTDSRPDTTSTRRPDIMPDMGPHTRVDLLSGLVSGTSRDTAPDTRPDSVRSTVGDIPTRHRPDTGPDTAVTTRPDTKPTPNRTRNRSTDRTSGRTPKWTAQQLRAFKMRDEDDATYGQIARKLNVAEKTVSRWFKARNEAEQALRVPTLLPNVLTVLPAPAPPVMSGTNGHTISVSADMP